MSPIARYRKAALVLAGIFYALMIGIGSIPNEANELSTFVPDYVLHFTAYGFLSVLIAFGQGLANRRRALAVLLCIALMGALDEAIQSTLSYRTADIHDWLVDMLAAAVVTGLYAAASLRRRAARTA